MDFVFLHCFEFIRFLGWTGNLMSTTKNLEQSSEFTKPVAVSWHTEDIEGILNECSIATNSLKNPVQFSKF